MSAAIEQCRPLLRFIGKWESRNDYNIVWGGIRRDDRPEARVGKRLTQMTIGEVLAWQDSIDEKYMSEAAGYYQILEDTLRDIYPAAGMRLSDLFDEAGQDRLAYALLERRRLKQYLAGALSPEAFANRLAREWASLPVVTGPQKGRSFYAGDGLNQSHVKVEPFLDSIRAIRTAPAMPTAPARGDAPARPDMAQQPEPDDAKTSIWAAIAAAIANWRR